MQSRLRQMSFSRQPEVKEPDIHISLAKTYKQVQDIIQDVKHSNNGSVGKYNYYGKKYRFEQNATQQIKDKQTIQSKQQSLQTINFDNNNIKKLKRAQSQSKHCNLSNTPNIPLRYEIIFEKQLPLEKRSIQKSNQNKHKYFQQKISKLQKQVSDLKTQNQRLRRQSISFGVTRQSSKPKQRKIHFKEFIKDL